MDATNVSIEVDGDGAEGPVSALHLPARAVRFMVDGVRQMARRPPVCWRGKPN